MCMGSSVLKHRGGKATTLIVLSCSSLPGKVDISNKYIRPINHTIFVIIVGKIINLLTTIVRRRCVNLLNIYWYTYYNMYNIHNGNLIWCLNRNKTNTKMHWSWKQTWFPGKSELFLATKLKHVVFTTQIFSDHYIICARV